MKIETAENAEANCRLYVDSAYHIYKQSFGFGKEPVDKKVIIEIAKMVQIEVGKLE